MICGRTCRWVLLALAVALSACSPRTMLVRGMADQLAQPDPVPEDDPLLARDAGAFHLKLLESVLRQDPGHLPLAAAVSGGFTQYAYAFVAFEAEKLESRDVRAAEVLQARAVRLYARAQRHALAALERRYPGFLQRLRGSDDETLATGWLLPRDAVAVAYWAAASWGARIALSKDDPDTVADLPVVIRLARLAWQTDPDHGEGALSTLMGTLELARPGGNRAAAEAHFRRAVQASQGQSAGPFIAMAEGLALSAGDRAAYEAWLRQALAAAAQRQDVASVLLRQRATWLLETADDRF